MPATSSNHDWELATSTSSISSTATTVVLSGSEDEEEYDLESSPSLTSDLEDEEIWQGLGDEGSFSESSGVFSPSPSSPSYRRRMAFADDDDNVYDTPLQSTRHLDNEEEEAVVRMDPDLTVSGIDPSEVSSSTSTFSFHFPDPLKAPEEGMEGQDAYEELVRRGLMRTETEETMATMEGLGSMMFDSDMVESVDRLLKRSSTTLFPLPQSVPSSSPPPASKKRTHRIALWPIGIATALVLLWLSVYLNQLKSSSLLYPVIHRQSDVKVFHHEDTPSQWRNEPVALVDAVVDRPPKIEAGVPPLANGPSPSRDFPLISTPSLVHLPPKALPNENLTTVTPLSFQPWTRVINSISHYYGTFSNILLHDLREISRMIEELLLFLRETAVVSSVRARSQTAMEYLMERMSHRHERAKRNAKVLGAKGMHLVRKASREFTVVQENLRMWWKGVDEVVEAT
ncbi:hypothetical protein FRC19_001795 [Serendipita sp. 401]|nr:hypothetical protein FRC19_001795 [Serendipita sp. 401]